MARVLGESEVGGKTYLEALVGSLTASNVLARVGDDNTGDLVVVAPEESLCSANNVSDYDRGAQREDDVLVVRMQDQSLVHLACEEEMGPVSSLTHSTARALRPGRQAVPGRCPDSGTLTLEADHGGEFEIF